VRIELDGQELYDPFHLQDFDSALSLVAASSLAGVHLTTGAFPARYGDRMGGVLELVTSPPGAGRRARRGASVLGLEAASSGGGERTGWLVLGRAGTARLVEEIVGGDRPDYYDLLGRYEWRASERQTLRLHALAGGDRLDLVETGDEPKRIDTAYDSGYLWLDHQLLVSPRAFVDSAVAATRLERDRQALEADDEKRIAVDDPRTSRILELRQSWHFDLGDGRGLDLGGSWRRSSTDYDYDSLRSFETPLAAIRAEPRDGRFAFHGRLEEEPLGLFASHRRELRPNLALELGLRWDDHPLTDESAWSPRAQLAWSRGATVVRAAGGLYHQSQRSYELGVVDGDAQIYPLERAEHLVVGLEREERRGPLASWRLELYERSVEDPRPRYESLLEPFDAFPEGEIDRYRFAPESSRARGAELFLRLRERGPLAAWLAWTFSESLDRIDGRSVPRLVDQRHAGTLNLRFRLPREWTLDLVAVFHTGRPTTRVEVLEVPAGSFAHAEDDDDDEEEDDDDDDGEEPPTVFVPVLGPLNGERLADYHRLDLRISRRFALERGELSFFVDVQNLYDRENAAGTSIELDSETGELVRDPELWPGFFASAGVAWEF
jgi:hypothetical protein